VLRGLTDLCARRVRRYTCLKDLQSGLPTRLYRPAFYTRTLARIYIYIYIYISAVVDSELNWVTIHPTSSALCNNCITDYRSTQCALYITAGSAGPSKDTRSSPAQRRRTGRAARRQCRLGSRRGLSSTATATAFGMEGDRSSRLGVPLDSQAHDIRVLFDETTARSRRTCTLGNVRLRNIGRNYVLLLLYTLPEMSARRGGSGLRWSDTHRGTVVVQGPGEH